VLERVWSEVPAAAGGSVMASGIVSVGLWLDGRKLASDVLFAIAGALWVFLAVAFAGRLAIDRRRWAHDATLPASLTSVAACAVLGSRLALAGWSAVSWALAGLAVVLLALLLPRVRRQSTSPRADGSSFLETVALQALAALLAALAVDEGERWPAIAGLVLVIAGVVLYLTVLARFDARQIGRGAGDQWVLGGAAAITALAASTVHLAGVVPWLSSALAWTAWAWAMLCLIPLVAGELIRPRLRYDIRRWATAFPVGMYAACSFALANSQHVAFARYIADVMVWIAVLVWLAVAYGAVRHLTGRSPGARG
jgi:tellurite resistance protein TehA-like permease